jgi:hypothetical protein
MLTQGNNSSVDRASIGSPEQVDDLEGTPSPRPKSIENTDRRKLSLDQRSFSSPYAPLVYSARLGGTTPQSPGVTSSSRRPVSGRQSPGERQWSLFGQVMENELRGSASRRLKKHPSMPSGSLEAYFLSESMPEYSESRIHSPTADLPPSGDDTSDDYDSDTFQTSRAPTRPTPVEPAPRWYSMKSLPTPSNLHQSIIKCVIAYFIASLFTFSPYLSTFISDITSDNEPGNSRPSPAGHMVATV